MLEKIKRIYQTFDRVMQINVLVQIVVEKTLLNQSLLPIPPDFARTGKFLYSDIFLADKKKTKRKRLHDSFVVVTYNG